jgi:hypothetical protein
MVIKNMGTGSKQQEQAGQSSQPDEASEATQADPTYNPAEHEQSGKKKDTTQNHFDQLRNTVKVRFQKYI